MVESLVDDPEEAGTSNESKWLLFEVLLTLHKVFTESSLRLEAWRVTYPGAPRS